MIDWRDVFTQDYLFGLERGVLHRIDWATLILGGALTLIGLIIWVLNRRRKNLVSKELWGKISRFCLTIGLLEALWFALRYESAQWLGLRITAVIVLVIGLVWGSFIIKYFFSAYRVKKVVWEKEQVKLKYLQG